MLCNGWLSNFMKLSVKMKKYINKKEILKFCAEKEDSLVPLNSRQQEVDLIWNQCCPWETCCSEIWVRRESNPPTFETMHRIFSYLAEKSYWKDINVFLKEYQFTKKIWRQRIVKLVKMYIFSVNIINNNLFKNIKQFSSHISKSFQFAQEVNWEVKRWDHFWQHDVLVNSLFICFKFFQNLALSGKVASIMKGCEDHKYHGECLWKTAKIMALHLFSILF